MPQVDRRIDDYFFFSYARSDESDELEDSREYLFEFYKDLCDEIRDKNPGLLKETDPVGFYDQLLKLGANYGRSLPEALQSCKCLVCLYSPKYFTRPICGREVQVFLDRQALHTSPPEVILPVIWKKPESIPRALELIQYTHRAFPGPYIEKGLRELMIQRNYKLEYRQFVVEMGKWIMDARKENLHALAGFLDFDKVTPAFPTISASGVPDTIGTVATEGPKTVRFVYVARTTPVAGWRPFPPPPPDNMIGPLAYLKALSKGFYPAEIPLTPSLVAELEQAKKNNTLVVLLVDPETLDQAPTETLLKEYDRYNFLNSAALVVWDATTARSSSREAALRNKLTVVFDDNYARTDPRFFRDNIRTLGELEVELSDTLDSLYRNVISKGLPSRSVPTGQTLPTI